MTDNNNKKRTNENSKRWRSKNIVYTRIYAMFHRKNENMKTIITKLNKPLVISFD
jgi:hypothetical protein